MTDDHVAPPLHPGDRAPDATLLDQTGGHVQLSSLWSSAPNGTVVIFLRHFGCMFCREHAVRLRKSFAEIEARGVRLVAVGLGSAEDAAGFADWLKLPYPVLASPDRHVHARWGLGRTTARQMVSPGLIKAGLRATSQKAVQGKTTGDARQLPGAFIVDPEGIIRWARPSAHPGDNVPTAELLAAIDANRVGVAA